MASEFVVRSLGHATSRVPGLRRVPVLKLVTIGELGLLAHQHYMRLTPKERQRLIALLREHRGRPGRLTPEERDELSRLAAKLEPRVLAGEAVNRFSPVPLPRRLTMGPNRKRRRR